MHTWYAYFPFNWSGQRSVKTLPTALRKYFYQNGKAFPSHPERAKTPLAFPSPCRGPASHDGPVLPAPPDELNTSDGAQQPRRRRRRLEGALSSKPRRPCESPGVWDCIRSDASGPPRPTKQAVLGNLSV